MAPGGPAACTAFAAAASLFYLRLATVCADDFEDEGSATCLASGLHAAGCSGLPPVEVAGEGEAYPRYLSIERAVGARVWTSEELRLHAGTDKDRPLLLAIVGEVFDVGTGAKHYGPGSGYSRMAGGDRGRVFADLEAARDDDNVSAKIIDLSVDDIESVLSWRRFYRDHKTYRFVGFVAGRYFSPDGRPTDEQVELERIYEAYQRGEAVREGLRTRFPRCSSQHESPGDFTDFWCEDTYHQPGSVPVHLHIAIPGARAPEPGWCTCWPPSKRQDVDAEARADGSFRLADYGECAAGSQRCRRRKGARPPP